MLKKLVDSATAQWPVLILALGLLCLTSSTLAGGGRLLKTDISKDAVIPNESTLPDLAYTAGNLVVKLYGSDSTNIDLVNSQYGTTVDKYLARLQLYLLTIPDGTNPDTLAAQVAQIPWVEYAQPNYVTDPLNPVQGSYPFPDLTHQGDFDGQEAASLLQLNSVHLTATGAGVTVGVLDGGVDYTHPRFNGQVESGWDYVDDDNDAVDEPGGDNSGHGTFVAGVVALMAPNATIRAYRVSDVDGKSEGYLLAEAIMQAVDDGCDIINLSLAMTHPHSAVGDALQYAADHGVLVVAAAGNGGLEEVRYPASDQNAVAVAAIDSLGLLAEFSNFGADVDVCAPGAWIYSPFQNDGYAWWDGTSFASPFVAGQAALLLSRNLSATVGQLRSAILVSADDLDATNPAYSGKLGQGLIDPLAALGYFAGSDSAMVFPDTIKLSVPVGTMDTLITIPFLMSSNAPASFTAEVVNTGDRFVQLFDYTGVTDDSVMLAVFPAWPFSAGVWYNSVSFAVEGTKAPVELVIELTLTQGGDEETAWITPGTVDLTIPQGWLGMASEVITVNSSNAPAFYSVNGGAFTIVQDSTGLTGDTTYVHLDPTGLSIGTHCDTLLFNVVGVPSPAQMIVCLTITGDTTGPATAWTEPSSFAFSVPEGGDSVAGCFWVRSSNHPSTYTTWYDTTSFMFLTNPTGPTGSMPCVLADPEGYAPGTYCDSILFFVDGVDNPFSLSVCMTVTDTTSSNDSMWVSPTFVSVEIQQGSVDSVFGCIDVGSTNEPAEIYGDVLRQYLPPDVQMTKMWDTTPGSLCYMINPAGLNPGTYCDTILIAVEGVTGAKIVPVCVTVLPDTSGGGGDSAWASPAYLSFQLPMGSDTAIDCLTILSSNQPAAFAIAPDTDSFVHVTDLTGMTGGGTCVIVDPMGFGPGSYCDSLMVTVAGVTDPLRIYVCMLITPDTSGGGSDTAWAYPSMVSVEITEGSTDSIYGCIDVSSSNAPALLYGDVLRPNLPPDVRLVDPWATTPGSLCYVIDPSGLAPGTYCDTIRIAVQYVDQAIAVPVCVTVVPDTGSYPPIIAIPSEVYVTLAEGGSGVTSCLLISSNNMPRDYSISLSSAGGPTFISYTDTIGTTEDSVCLFIDPTGYAPGMYCDSLLVWATGVWSPLPVPVCMLVVADSSVGDPDTAWVDPATISFTEPYGADTAIECFSIYSTNQPAVFYIADDSSSIFMITDSEGVTGQNSCVIADPSGLAPGIYCDTLWIYVDGCFGFLPLPVCLTVTPGDTLPAFGVSLDGNYPNPFNPETNISFSLPHAMDVRLTVYNVLGQQIRTLVDQTMTAGQHVVSWDGTSESGQSVASGIYFYRLATDVKTETRKMLLLK